MCCGYQCCTGCCSCFSCCCPSGGRQRRQKYLDDPEPAYPPTTQYQSPPMQQYYPPRMPPPPTRNVAPSPPKSSSSPYDEDYLLPYGAMNIHEHDDMEMAPLNAPANADGAGYIVGGSGNKLSRGKMIGGYMELPSSTSYAGYRQPPPPPVVPSRAPGHTYTPPSSPRHAWAYSESNYSREPSSPISPAEPYLPQVDSQEPSARHPSILISGRKPVTPSTMNV